MGHKNNDTFMSYISNISGVDVQNIISGRQQDQATIDFLRSMRTHIDFDAPRPKGSSLEDLRYGKPSISQERSVYSASARDRTQGTITSLPLNDRVVRPPPSRAFGQYLKFDQARAKLISLLDQDEQPSLATLLAAMMELARPDPSRWWYPGAAPDPVTAACVCGRVDKR